MAGEIEDSTEYYIKELKNALKHEHVRDCSHKISGIARVINIDLKANKKINFDKISSLFKITSIGEFKKNRARKPANRDVIEMFLRGEVAPKLIFELGRCNEEHNIIRKIFMGEDPLKKEIEIIMQTGKSEVTGKRKRSFKPRKIYHLKEEIITTETERCIGTLRYGSTMSESDSEINDVEIAVKVMEALAKNFSFSNEILNARTEVHVSDARSFCGKHHRDKRISR